MISFSSVIYLCRMPGDEKELLQQFIKNIHPLTDEEQDAFAAH
jgi:hypothetical protein